MTSDDQFSSGSQSLPDVVQDLQGAADAYTVLLALPDAAPADRLAAASNRAACSLAQRSFSNAVDDCNLALAMLAGSNAEAACGVFDFQAWITLGEGGAPACLCNSIF